uniref:Uncharacterized protein n=1 Tax=Pararge aegeria TaxID=116150 RepID=S4NWL4_9NEOP
MVPARQVSCKLRMGWSVITLPHQTRRSLHSSKTPQLHNLTVYQVSRVISVSELSCVSYCELPSVISVQYFVISFSCFIGSSIRKDIIRLRKCPQY